MCSVMVRMTGTTTEGALEDLPKDARCGEHKARENEFGETWERVERRR